MSLPLVISALVVSALVAIVGSETKRPVLMAVAKPLTTILLFAVVGPPQSTFAWLVDLGIAFSLIGDVALLWARQDTFLIGLASFLVAHAVYIVAFLGATAIAAAGHGGLAGAFSSPQVLGAAVVMAVGTIFLLRAVWPGAAGLRGPLVAYAIALGAMVVAAIAAASTASMAASSLVASSGASVSGGTVVSPLAAVGAVLFFVSDASLALNQFHRPIKHAPVLTLGVYWLGQLGIALGARFFAT